MVDAGKTLDQGGYPAPGESSSSKHTKHIDNNAYVTNDCNDCHGANATTGNHTGHKNGTVETVPGLNYNATNKVCTTTCHVTENNDWTNAQPLQCADCHAATYIGGGANMPASGLHTGTPTITGNTHGNGTWDAESADGAAAADCVTCHTTAPTNPATSHINGTFDASIGADDTQCSPRSYDTRMVMSWMGWMEWPDALLAHLAHDGFDGIYDSNLANPNGDRTTAETSTDFYARILFRMRKQDPARMRDLINRPPALASRSIRPSCTSIWARRKARRGCAGSCVTSSRSFPRSEVTCS